MCIAILKPADIEIPEQHLRTSFENNPDGAGFAVARDGRVVIRKGFEDIESFLVAYRSEVHVSDPALIHFRITTRGASDAENCHPFRLKHGALIHNGTIHKLGSPAGQGRSDTNELAADVIHTLTRTQLEALRPMVEEFIGWSKLALLFDDGEWLIFNEQKGVNFNGAWYSNDGFKQQSTYAGTALTAGKRWGYSSYYSPEHYTTYDDEEAPVDGTDERAWLPDDVYIDGANAWRYSVEDNEYTEIENGVLGIVASAGLTRTSEDEVRRTMASAIRFGNHYAVQELIGLQEEGVFDGTIYEFVDFVDFTAETTTATTTSDIH